jgi:secreted trypsin-like serine protease
MKLGTVLALLLLGWAPSARAVVVLSGASNTSAPGGQPYFNNVGVVNGASGIYLGNRWVLTAAHVAGTLPSAATFGGINYSALAGSYQRLHNPGGYGFTSLTDLALFRLATDPGLPTVSINSGSPAVNADVMMIGRGRDQAASVTYWDVTVNTGINNDVWTEVPAGTPGIDREGFKTSDSRTIRWGENDVAANGQVFNYSFGSPSQVVDVISFTTSFDAGAKTHEAQAVSGDSGGAVFVDNSGTWTLAGVMLTVQIFDNQPWAQPGAKPTAVIGNQTVMADLSYYRGEIFSITSIPEPGVALLCVLGGCVFSGIRRRGSSLLYPRENP